METREGLVYLPNSDLAYTGDAVSHWPNGKKSMEKTFNAEVGEGFIQVTVTHRQGGHQYKTGQTEHDPSENSSVPDLAQPMNRRWICQAIQPSTAPGIRSTK